jgi:VWFA-related protein
MRCLLIFLVIAYSSVAGAQTIGQNGSADNDKTFTLSVRSQLVTETVTVRDKAGNPVPGLTAKDFVLSEDGVPQKIRYCEHQTLSRSAVPMSTLGKNQGAITIYKTLSRGQIAQESSDELRYSDHRLLAIYFDISTMTNADRYRAIEAAETFISTQMTPVDLVSILRFNEGSVDVLQDFTAERNRLLSVLATLKVGENQEWATTASDPRSADTGAAFGQDDSEFNIFNTDRQLAALQTAAQMLGHLNEKKALIYFASGIMLNGIDNQAQLHATVDAAIRAGVTVWPVDARGLVAQAPLGDATQGSPGGANMYSGVSEQSVQADLAQSQDTLYSLAADTGGKALLDTNDLARGITLAQRSISDYYVLSYYSTNSALDGRFRRIKISVNHPEVGKIDYREGYYADKQFAKFNAADKERQLEDALMLEDPITDLTIAMELDYFQLNSAEYFVPVIVKIPGHELALARHGGADHTLLDLIGEIRDINAGGTVTNIRDIVKIKLSEQTEAQLARVPIEYDSGFTLLPGSYSIKFLARDDETGRIGTYETTFTIPNLNKEEQHVPISSVILSSQRVPLQGALYNAIKGKDKAKEDAFNPLVSDGNKLIPSVTHVFSRNRALFVYLQGYEPSAAPPKPLIAFVSLYRDRALQLQSQPIAATPLPSQRLKPVAFSFTIDLSHLKVGEYDCQISVLDPVSGKSTFWRTPIQVSP